MRLVNNLDCSIMYGLNEDPNLELKPMGFASIPDICTNLKVKPTDTTYTLSADQLFDYPRGSVEKIVVSNDIKPSRGNNVLIMTEDNEPGIGKTLKFLYQDAIGMGERLYFPRFDITKYDLDGQPIVIIDPKKVSDKLSKMSESPPTWWITLFIILVLVCLLPVIAFVVIGSHGSEHD